jgi:hypothetical protein
MVRSVYASLVVVVFFALPAAAQPGRGAPPTPDDMPPGQVHQLFDAMLAMQAQNALALNDQQYARFLGRLRALQETRRRNQQERARIVNELQRLTNPRNAAPAEADVRTQLAALQELEARTAAELRRAYNNLDEVLTTVQQARFRVLEDQIERRKLELVARARLNNQQNRPTGRPPARRPPGR